LVTGLKEFKINLPFWPGIVVVTTEAMPLFWHEADPVTVVNDVSILVDVTRHGSAFLLKPR